MTKDQIKRVLAYVRVSTSEQGDSGLGLEAQREAIGAECGRRGWELVEIHQDVASGKSLNGRAELARALADLAAGRADALLVTKLDRLSRSLLDFAGMVDRAKREGWALVVVGGDFDMSTPNGRLMANMLATFAEYEREIISQRTKDALAVAKAKGRKLGRKSKVSPEVQLRIVAMRAAGMTFEAIAAALTAEGVATPTAADHWAWQSVSQIVRRHGEKPVRTRRRPV